MRDTPSKDALGPDSVYICYQEHMKEKERPSPHYSVKRHLNRNDCDTYSQVVHKCCFHSQHAAVAYTLCARARMDETLSCFSFLAAVPNSLYGGDVAS